MSTILTFCDKQAPQKCLSQQHVGSKLLIQGAPPKTGCICAQCGFLAQALSPLLHTSTFKMSKGNWVSERSLGSCRTLVRNWLNLFYKREKRHEMTQEEWREFEADERKLARRIGVTVDEMRQLHAQKSQQIRFLHAAHLRSEQDVAVAISAPAWDSAVWLAVFADHHGRTAEEALLVSYLCLSLSGTISAHFSANFSLLTALGAMLFSLCLSQNPPEGFLTTQLPCLTAALHSL